MTNALKQALESLATTYGSLDAMAMRLPVDAKEVATALAKADPTSGEYVALTYLAKYNPYESSKPAPETQTEQ
jgi:hypothetical protein